MEGLENYGLLGAVFSAVSGLIVYLFKLMLKNDKDKEVIRAEATVKESENTKEGFLGLAEEVKTMGEKIEKFGETIENLVVKDIQNSAVNKEIREENKEMYIRNSNNIAKLNKDTREALTKANENIMEVKNIVKTCHLRGGFSE